MRESAYIGTEDTSQELFLDVLKTIPTEVQYAEVSFLADGIPEARFIDSNEDEYLKECQSKGVIPFSRVKLEYDRRTKVFIPNNGLFRSFLELYEGSSEAKKNAAIKGLLKGGRMHVLSFKTGIYSDEYNIFQRDYLEQIVGEGYQIGEADLWLKTYCLTGYNEGVYRESGLTLGRTRNKGVGLEVPELADWFTSLANKHGVKVLQAEQALNSKEQ